MTETAAPPTQASLEAVQDPAHVTDAVRYIVFTLGGERFALPLLAIREVIAPPEITPVPFSPTYFLGIMNLRGQVISVIDLRLKLQVKTDKSPENAIIIVDLGATLLGMWVDSVDFVMTPSPEQTHLPPNASTSTSSRISIERVFRHGDGLILSVDPMGVLSPEDRGFLNVDARKESGKSAAA
jgi:purine-binding chemotaxis protein CheW